MNDFKTLLDTLIAEGFRLSSRTDGRELDYKITPYSLNTKLSFRFDDLEHFVAFLRESDPGMTDDRITVLYATFNELALKPNEFFYVNFFEKGKELEM